MKWFTLKSSESLYKGASLSAGDVSDQWFHLTATSNAQCKLVLYLYLHEDIHLTIFPFLSLAIKLLLPNKPAEAVEQQAALQMSYIKCLDTKLLIKQVCEYLPH